MNRWKQDTAASIIQDFTKYQEALAELRYQEQTISIAITELPQSEKKTCHALSQLLATSAIPGKKIQAAEDCFIRRMTALNSGEKTRALQLLANFPIPTPDSAAFEKTDALLHRIHELASEQTRQAPEPYFDEIAKITKNFDRNDQPLPARERYQGALKRQHSLDAKKFLDTLIQQEDTLAADLEKGPSIWRQRGLGLFFLLLHAGAAAHSFERMEREAANLPRRADRLQKELIAIAGKQAERGAAFIGTMLSDKYEDLQTMSEADLQRMTRRFPDDVREALEPFRTGAPKPSPEEIFAIHQQYILKHTNPSFKEQISNWYTQFTTNQEDKAKPQRAAKAQSDDVAVYEQLAPDVALRQGAHLMEALRRKDFARSIELLKGADIHIRNENGDTPLHLACFDPSILSKLIEQGADINAINKQGKTPLHMAVGGEHSLSSLKIEYEQSALRLLKAGTDPNAKDAEGNTPLSAALKAPFFSEKVIKSLLKAGADPNTKVKVNGLNYSVLELAIFRDKLSSVKALIEHGADLHSEDSPLIYARGEEVAKALLRAGADTMTKNGKSILSIAIKNKVWGLAKALLEKKSSSTRPSLSELKILVAEGTNDCLQAVARRFNITHYPEIFNPSNFVRFSRTEFLAQLLDKGLDINLSDQNGMTALHWAYLLNLPNVPQFLLARGADPYAVNRLGMEPTALIPNEETLENQIKASNLQSTAKIFPPEVLEKLKDKAINKGISMTSLSSALPLLPAPLNTSLMETSLVELVTPVAVIKMESDMKVRKTIPAKTGALRQRLGYLTGKYLDKLFLQHPIADIQGFSVPETIIRHTLTNGVLTPVSVTRFVSSSVDMGDSLSQTFPQGEWTKLFILDLILGNTDRHAYNYRVQTTLNETGEPLRRIIPIDHDLSLPDITNHQEYRWAALSYMPEEPLSEEWKNFILGIDANALWNDYEKEATAYKTTYAEYTNGETGINDDVYLNFQARIKTLQEGVRHGWSANDIGWTFFRSYRITNNTLVYNQGKYETFFHDDTPNLTREERKVKIFSNIMDYFANQQK